MIDSETVGNFLFVKIIFTKINGLLYPQISYGFLLKFLFENLRGAF
jgi:hypothetical protein